MPYCTYWHVFAIIACLVYLMSIYKIVPLGTLFLWEAGGICRYKDKIFLISSRFFWDISAFFRPESDFQALWKAILYFFCIKRYNFWKNVYLCNVFWTASVYWLAAIGMQECRSPKGGDLRDENLYIGKALLDAWLVGIWQFQNCCQTPKQQWRPWICNIRHMNCWQPS